MASGLYIPSFTLSINGKELVPSELETLVQDAITREDVEPLYHTLTAIAEKQHALFPTETNQEWYDRQVALGVLEPSTYPEDLAHLSNAITMIEEHMYKQGSLRSCSLAYAKDEHELLIPVEKKLFLVGHYAGTMFKYTVRNDEKLAHDLAFGYSPDTLHFAEGAFYEVENIPRIPTLQSYLLNKYISIKREIARDKLQFYPIKYGAQTR